MQNRDLCHGAQVTPTQARQVLAVARHRSFSNAARSLGASQAAVSNAVATTEAMIGLTLFHRTTRTVTPTSAFRELAAKLERLVRADDALLKAVEHARHTEAQIVRVGVSPVVDASVVDPLLAAFERGRDTPTVELRELNLKDLETALGSGEVDLGIAPVVGRSRFRSFALYSDPLVIVGLPGSGLVKLETLGGTPLILMPDACGLTRSTVQLFRRGKLSLVRAPTTALGYHLLERSALRGRGVAILPSSKVSDGTPVRQLVVGDDRALLEVRVVQRRGSASASQRELADLLKRAAR